ncbi:NPCBM/NEW2 domain-containing protein [Nonomuraea sp. NPDC052265]|uniref:NPCBM/NEW2 domain-containing protein n=1 Tax=Nonomuraea sp. NPDC052265 TaxID=3364374 RepID=UPI0037CB8871
MSEAVRVAVIGAVATVAAAVITVVFTAGGQDAEVTSSRSPSVSPSAGSSTPTSAPSPSASASASAESQSFSLVDQPAITDDDKEGWGEDPLQVNGKTYDRVLSASPCYLNDNFSVTFVTGRKYARLTASIGVADTSPVARPLKFSVQADRRTVFSKSVGLGQVKKVDVDVRDAIQVSIVVSTTSTQQCHGDTTGVWIDPQLF